MYYSLLLPCDPLIFAESPGRCHSPWRGGCVLLLSKGHWLCQASRTDRAHIFRSAGRNNTFVFVFSSFFLLFFCLFSLSRNSPYHLAISFVIFAISVSSRSTLAVTVTMLALHSSDCGAFACVAVAVLSCLFLIKTPASALFRYASACLLLALRALSLHLLAGIAPSSPLQSTEVHCKLYLRSPLPNTPLAPPLPSEVASGLLFALQMRHSRCFFYQSGLRGLLPGSGEKTRQAQWRPFSAIPRSCGGFIIQTYTSLEYNNLIGLNSRYEALRSHISRY